MKIMNAEVNDYVRASIAGPADTAEVKELVLETARWLRSQGSTQWSGMLSGKDDHNLEGAVTRGEVMCYRDALTGELAGTMILQQEASAWDCNLWEHEPPDHGKSVYLHRLVAGRKYSGRGLGRDMVMWANYGLEYEDKDRIRLDCIAGNEKLADFYRSCGYSFKGEVKGFNIFEKLLLFSSPFEL